MATAGGVASKGTDLEKNLTKLIPSSFFMEGDESGSRKRPLSAIAEATDSNTRPNITQAEDSSALTVPTSFSDINIISVNSNKTS